MKKVIRTEWVNVNDMSGFLLYSAYFSWKRKIENSLLPHDLTLVQFILLVSIGFLVRDGEDISQNDLAKFLRFDVTMTSQVLRNLERKGLLSRSQKEGDERAKFPKLTESGEHKIQEAAKDLLKTEDDFFSSLADKKSDLDEFLRGVLKKEIADVN
ncbi:MULTISPECIES: MarR family winged helix-turn-helix transcriptional regulator [Candidatus Ichthyocystis]|uniref:Putative transcriptional regulator, MarR family n=1 Tax=Candidatus Ichthyocystis hellenicum TaxID=1561003 RepID=A0A0S4M6I2_9BURK|nr:MULTISPECIES: MarR family transcriptional regulator [Ichthyocystis]CUT17752.1 putative transcriptional regulator, MarR family [Candidatus Ichthyocystis hellenicum]